MGIDYQDNINSVYYTREVRMCRIYNVFQCIKVEGPQANGACRQPDGWGQEEPGLHESVSPRVVYWVCVVCGLFPCDLGLRVLRYIIRNRSSDQSGYWISQDGTGGSGCLQLVVTNCNLRQKLPVRGSLDHRGLSRGTNRRASPQKALKRPDTTIDLGVVGMTTHARERQQEGPD